MKAYPRESIWSSKIAVLLMSALDDVLARYILSPGMHLLPSLLLSRGEQSCLPITEGLWALQVAKVG